MADLEVKKFAQFFRFSADFQLKFLVSKTAETKILLWNVDMENKLYKVIFFHLCNKKMELMKQIHLFKKGFVIFLKGAPFSDFIETGL